MKNETESHDEPRYAPGLELDNIKEDATPDEVERGDFTPVVSLILDRTGDDNIDS